MFGNRDSGEDRIDAQLLGQRAEIRKMGDLLPDLDVGMRAEIGWVLGDDDDEVHGWPLVAALTGRTQLEAGRRMEGSGRIGRAPSNRN